MRAIVILSAMALASGVCMRPALAAHAGAPYTNVDHSNDAGNNTGDSEVDKLNGAQLNSNYYRDHPAPAPGQPIIPGR